MESWDTCAFSPVPGETQSNERLVPVGDTDPEALHANQDAYSRESPGVIDNQPLFDLIQAGFKTIEGHLNATEGCIKAIENCFNIVKQLLDFFGKKQDDYKQYVMGTLQQHGI